MPEGSSTPKWLPRTWWGTCLQAFAVQASIGVPLLLCEGLGCSLIGWVVLMVPLLLTAVVVVAIGVVTITQRWRAGWRLLLWGLVGFFSGRGLMQLTWQVRYAAFAACAEQAQPLIDAIARFARERGQAPARLDDLAPAFMPRVPATGLPDYPTFDYGRPGWTEGVEPPQWELMVHCSYGFVSFDKFFYWPTQNYPEQIYGGRVKRIGTWAYVHE